MMSFGDKHCVICSLTVAEYINGRMYPNPNGPNDYMHDRCYEKMLHSPITQTQPIKDPQGGNDHAKTTEYRNVE